MQNSCGNVCQTMDTMKSYLGHVQVAGVPGRHEPDQEQELNIPFIFKHLRTALGSVMLSSIVEVCHPLSRIPCFSHKVVLKTLSYVSVPTPSPLDTLASLAASTIRGPQRKQASAGSSSSETLAGNESFTERGFHGRSRVHQVPHVHLRC